MAIKKKSSPKAVKKSTAKKAPAKKSVKKVASKKAAPKAARKMLKKTTVKKVVKKAAPKKVTAAKAKTTSKKPLVVAPNEKSFWVTNGAVLNSLIALRDALDEMEREVYSYHVSKEHNDFAAWVDAVLADEKCAKDLAKANDPEKAKTVVVKHLKVYAV